MPNLTIENLTTEKPKRELELALSARGFFTDVSREEWSRVLATKDYAALYATADRRF